MNLFTKQKQIHRLKEWTYGYWEKGLKKKTSLVIDFLLGNEANGLMVGREIIIQKTTSSLLLESSRTVTHWERIQGAGYVYFLWSWPHALITIHHLLDGPPGTCHLTSSSFGLLHWKRRLAMDQSCYTNEGPKLSLASVHGVAKGQGWLSDWTELSFSITGPFGLNLQPVDLSTFLQICNHHPTYNHHPLNLNAAINSEQFSLISALSSLQSILHGIAQVLFLT